MCKLFPTVRLLAVAMLIFLGASCSEDVPGFVVPTPDDNKDNTQTENPKPDEGKDDLTEESVANLCDEEFLGQKPMIIAYYTENSSALPDPSCLTHINYAHGRFVDKDSERGFEWLTQSANNGYDRAQYYLGLCYINGDDMVEGMQPNLTMAVQWFVCGLSSQVSHGRDYPV